MPAVTTPKTFVCETCHATLQSQRELDTHLCLAHDDCGEAHVGTPITFRCATCGEAFSRRSDLFSHQKTRGHGHPGAWGKGRPAGAERSRRRPPGGRG
jgi:uncharacterized C2H2 Zn-finger protein